MLLIKNAHYHSIPYITAGVSNYHNCKLTYIGSIL